MHGHCQWLHCHGGMCLHFKTATPSGLLAQCQQRFKTCVKGWASLSIAVRNFPQTPLKADTIRRIQRRRASGSSGWNCPRKLKAWDAETVQNGQEVYRTTHGCKSLAECPAYLPHGVMTRVTPHSSSLPSRSLAGVTPVGNCEREVREGQIFLLNL